MAGRDNELNRLRHWRTTAPKGRVVYDEGEPSKAFYRVETGCVRLQVNRDDGRRQILAFCLPGDIFGVDFTRPRPMAAEAATASELTRFPTGDLCATTWNSKEWASVADSALEIITSLTTHLAGLAHTSAEDRLLWFLDWLAARQGVARVNGVLRPPMSRRDVADFLDLAPETLSRTFNRLAARGLVRAIDRRTLLLRPRPGEADTRQLMLRTAA